MKKIIPVVELADSYVIFADLVKAYDTVDRELLWKIMATTITAKTIRVEGLRSPDMPWSNQNNLA